MYDIHFHPILLCRNSQGFSSSLLSTSRRCSRLWSSVYRKGIARPTLFTLTFAFVNRIYDFLWYSDWLCDVLHFSRRISWEISSLQKAGSVGRWIRVCNSIHLSTVYLNWSPVARLAWTNAQQPSILEAHSHLILADASRGDTCPFDFFASIVASDIWLAASKNAANPGTETWGLLNIDFLLVWFGGFGI